MTERHKKVLGLSAFDKSSRQFNGGDLTQDLKTRGWDYQLGSFWETSDELDWSTPVLSGYQKLARATAGVEQLLGFQSRFQFWSEKILQDPILLSADVVHLHLVQNQWLTLATLEKIASRKPTLWTWHDLWPLTGHCIQPGQCARWAVGCGHCPDLSKPMPVYRDRTQKNRSEKIEWLDRLPVRVHVATEWMKRRIASNLPGDTNLDLVVHPFGITAPRLLGNSRRGARKKLGIPPDATVLLTRKGVNKGYEEVLKFARQFTREQDFLLLVIDSNETATSEAFATVHFPWIEDRESISSLFLASDFFLSPSPAESFGLLVLEAMYHGRIPLVIGGTASAEIVDQPDLEIDSNNPSKSMLDVIKYLIANPDRRSHYEDRMQKRAREEFSSEAYVDFLSSQYLELQASWKIKQT